MNINEEAHALFMFAKLALFFRDMQGSDHPEYSADMIDIQYGSQVQNIFKTDLNFTKDTFLVGELPVINI